MRNVEDEVILSKQDREPLALFLNLKMSEDFKISTSPSENLYSDDESYASSTCMSNVDSEVIKTARDQIEQLVSNTELRENEEWYFVPKKQFEDVLNLQVESLDSLRYKVGPIRCDAILDPNGLLYNDDNEIHASECIPKEAFAILLNILGIHGEPVKRIVVRNDDTGALEVERCPPYFYVHILCRQRSHYGNHHSKSGVLISRTAKFKDLMELIKRLVLKTSQAKEDIRLWFVTLSDSDFATYINIEVFIKSDAEKQLVQPEIYEASLTNRGIGPKAYHVAVEHKDAHSHIYMLDSYLEAALKENKNCLEKGGTLGLANLGNTCYMNSALQCLVHIPEVNHYFLYDLHLKELNKDNPLGFNGQIALAFGTLLHKLFDKSSANLSFISPRDFKYSIAHQSSQFRGYQQQDTQEFLSWLLDALHEDLNRILSKPYYEKPELKDDEINDSQAISKLAKKCRDQYKQRNDSIIVDLFTGLYRSTLVCPDCGKMSITFDPFNDLTLPLPTNKKWHHTFKIVNLGKSLEKMPSQIMSLEVELERNSTYDELLDYFHNFLNASKESIFLFEIFNGFFYRDFQEKYENVTFYPISEIISASDDIVAYIIPHDPKKDLIVPVLNAVRNEDDEYTMRSLFGIPLFIVLDRLEDLNNFSSIQRKTREVVQLLTQVNLNEKCENPMINENSQEEEFNVGSSSEGGDALQETTAVEDVTSASKTPVKNEENERQGFELYVHNDHNSHRRAPARIYRTDDSEDYNTVLHIPLYRPNLQNMQELSIVNSIDSGQKSDEDDAMHVCSSERDRAEEDGYVIIGNKENEQEEMRDEDKEVTREMLDEETDGGDLPIALLFDSTGALSTTSSAPRNASDACSQLSANSCVVCDWSRSSFAILFGDKSVDLWSKPPLIPNPQVEITKRNIEQQLKKSVSIYDCFRTFSTPEVLGSQDLWYCPRCKDHKQATKTIQIWDTGDILTIHLKRFQSYRAFSDKINMVVDFPIEGLDMGTFISDKENEACNIYDLIAVDNHYGGLGGGHYTASVKNFLDNNWYYYNDGSVSLIDDPNQCVTSAAYLLFYRRRKPGASFLGGDKLKNLLEEGRKHYEKILTLEKNNLLLIEKQVQSFRDFCEPNELTQEEAIDLDDDCKSKCSSRKLRSSSSDLFTDENRSTASTSCGRRKQRLISKEENISKSVGLQNPVGYSSSNLASPTSSVSDENIASDTSSLLNTEVNNEKSL